MILEIFGGVGSGKSVILNYLKEKDIERYRAILAALNLRK